MNRTDRCRGALVGLAVGDALGAAVEFEPPGTFPPVTGFRSGGPHGLDAGEWTDDTSMALALADSIKSKGWDLNDQARRYVQWWREGKYSVNGRCFDIGITTAQALRTFLLNRDALTSGPRAERSSGNGCIMRIAPVAIRHHDRGTAELAKLGAESSAPTHASPICLSASSYLTVLLAALIKGESREAVLANDWCKLELHQSVETVAKGSFDRKHPSEIRGTGYVVDCLEAALWAFNKANSFQEAVLGAVNLGDDADTTGAVCGQLAGAFWGESGIPARLRQGLARYDMLNEALDGLIPHSDES
jgi:ADP-ribosyl-[dinitrogen reductase] hydrolase